MLKIGDFARLANVTIKALRHYDQLDLLKPVYTDRYNGYRYYELYQLPRLNRILALKDLGFSLDQARQFLREDLPVERLQTLLAEHQAELETRLREEQVRLQRVEARLRQISQEGCPPQHEVLVKPIPNHWIAARAGLPAAAVDEGNPYQLRSQLLSWAAARDLVPAGPWMILQRPMPARDPESLLEIAQVVQPARKRSLAAFREDDIDLRLLLGCETMASVVHNGPRESMQSAYASLYTWSEHNGFVISGLGREICLAQDEDEAVECPVTELQVPVISRSDHKRHYFSVPERSESAFGPRFLTVPAFMAVGLPYVGKNEHGEIPNTWTEFLSRITEIEHKTGRMESFGLCYAMDEDGVFEYVCCVEVTRVDALPEGMVLRMVPEQDYAVFTHSGKLDSLGETYNYIFQNWLPGSGYTVAGSPDFELYTEEFRPGEEHSRFYIYLPIRLKTNQPG